MSYDVDGNIEELSECAFYDVFKYNFDVLSITSNVRKATDVTTTRSMPGLNIESFVEKTLPGVPEYKSVMELGCESFAAVDKTGAQVKAMAGVVRDILNCGNFTQQLNDQQRGIVFHDVREAETFRDDEEIEKVKRIVIRVDTWCYPGYENE